MCKAIWNDKPKKYMLSKGNGVGRVEPLSLKHREVACLSTCGASWIQGSEWQNRDNYPRVVE